MSKRKKTALILSNLAYMLIAIILADLVSSRISQILLLVSVGVICGLQNICIKKLWCE